MITINVTSNIKQVMDRVVGELRKQIPFATASALTRTAKDAQEAVTARLPFIFDQPTPFTMRAIAIKMATKASLTATVYIRPIQAAYLSLEITGGVLMPDKRARIVPIDIETVQGRSIPKGLVKRLLKRKDVFSGSVHGYPGLWQRITRGPKKGGLKLLIGYKPLVRYRQRFDFERLVRDAVKRTLLPNLNDALARAIATAR